MRALPPQTSLLLSPACLNVVCYRYPLRIAALHLEISRFLFFVICNAEQLETCFLTGCFAKITPFVCYTAQLFRSIEGNYPISHPGLLRISVGLEHPDDLAADLDAALTAALK